jgi:hypothetical protein
MIFLDEKKNRRSLRGQSIFLVSLFDVELCFCHPPPKGHNVIALVLAYIFNLDLKRLHAAPYYERDFKTLTAHTRTCEVELRNDILAGA